MLFMYTAWIIVSRAINSVITGNFYNGPLYWTEFARNALERCALLGFTTSYYSVIDYILYNIIYIYIYIYKFVYMFRNHYD